MAELTTTLAVLLLALAVLNPLHLWMPTALAMLILAAFFALCCALMVFVVRERARDEREAAHRSVAGRAAFLSGGAVLVAAIVAEDLSHAPIDPWLVAALVAMLVAKAAARLWSDRFR